MLYYVIGFRVEDIRIITIIIIIIIVVIVIICSSIIDFNIYINIFLYIYIIDIILLGEMMCLSFPFYIIFSCPIYNPNTEQITTSNTSNNNNSTNNNNNNNNILSKTYHKNDDTVYGGFHTLWDWDSVSIGLKKDGEISWKKFLLEVIQITGNF